MSGSHSSEVEHFIGNEEVSGSNPDVSTKFAIQGQSATGLVEVKCVLTECATIASALAGWSRGEKEIIRGDQNGEEQV